MNTDNGNVKQFISFERQFGKNYFKNLCLEFIATCMITFFKKKYSKYFYLSKNWMELVPCHTQKVGIIAIIVF